jgi:ABC-type Mn2+/Zn2+ transport system ATPase subunit
MLQENQDIIPKVMARLLDYPHMHRVVAVLIVFNTLAGLVANHYETISVSRVGMFAITLAIEMIVSAFMEQALYINAQHDWGAFAHTAMTRYKNLDDPVKKENDTSKFSEKLSRAQNALIRKSTWRYGVIVNLITYVLSLLYVSREEGATCYLVLAISISVAWYWFVSRPLFADMTTKRDKARKEREKISKLNRFLLRHLESESFGQRQLDASGPDPYIRKLDGLTKKISIIDLTLDFYWHRNILINAVPVIMCLVLLCFWDYTLALLTIANKIRNVFNNSMNYANQIQTMSDDMASLEELLGSKQLGLPAQMPAPERITLYINNKPILLVRGIIVQLVGATGGGKTTIINQIRGVEEEGVTNSLGCDLKSFRYTTAYMCQTKRSSTSGISIRTFFGADVKEGIKNSHIKKMLKAVLLWEWFQTVMGGNYDVAIDDRFSGGQSSLLYFAKTVFECLVCGKDVAIFDEPTTGVDKAREAIVLNNMMKLLENKIVLFVAHIAQEISQQLDFHDRLVVFSV